MKVAAKAPGKIIITGEHAVVHGNPAIIATLGFYTKVSISAMAGDAVIKCVDQRFGNYQFHWKDIEELSHIRKDGYALLKYMLKELLEREYKLEKVGLLLEISSNVPIGGFGSSTSFGAALLKALIGFYDLALTKQEQIEILINAETQFHGKVSGVDQSVVINGGLIKFQRKPAANTIESIPTNSGILKNVLVIESGKPNEETGEVVAWVGKRLEKEPNLVKKLFHSIEQSTLKIETALIENDREMFLRAIKANSDDLIDLGIVSERTQKLIKDISKFGGTAKVTGAGTITGEGSGAVSCFADDYTSIKSLLEKEGFKYHLVDLGV